MIEELNISEICDVNGGSQESRAAGRQVGELLVDALVIAAIILL